MSRPSFSPSAGVCTFERVLFFLQERSVLLSSLFKMVSLMPVVYFKYWIFSSRKYFNRVGPRIYNRHQRLRFAHRILLLINVLQSVLVLVSVSPAFNNCVFELTIGTASWLFRCPILAVRVVSPVCMLISLTLLLSERRAYYSVIGSSNSVKYYCRMTTIQHLDRCLQFGLPIDWWETLVLHWGVWVQMTLIPSMRTV